MIEKKIYNSWAYRSNAAEKYHMNFEIYKELKDKYRISRSSLVYNPDKSRFEDINLNEYDVVVDQVNVGYGNVLYRVTKNDPNLSTDELALICDSGNLCFGYAMRGNRICVYTD